MTTTASAAPPDKPKLTRRQTGDLAIQARAILREYCADCHSEGAGKRGRLSVLDHDTVTANVPVAFARREAAERSQILEFLVDGSMPPAGRPRPSDAQIEVLRKWIAADTPSYPRAFDEHTTRQRILDDVKKLDPKLVKHYRYISLAHLVEDREKPSLAAAELALQKALLASSKLPAPGEETSFVPQPIDPTATIFRLDLRPKKWDSPELFDKYVDGRREGVAAFVPYDMLLLEYPFATTLPPDEQDQAQSLFLGPTKQLRPVLYLRGDWLAEVLKPGTPLSEEMQSLTELAYAKDDGGATVGPTPRPFAAAIKPLTYTLPTDGTKPIPPLSATTYTDISTSPPPFTISVELVELKNTPTPMTTAVTKLPTNAKYNTRVKSNAQAAMQLLIVQADGEISLQPIKSGDQVTAERTKVVMPGNSENNYFFSAEPPRTEYHVYLFAKKNLPVPQIIRSMHSKNFIWRYYYPDLPVDGASVVRAVVPIPIVANLKK